VHRHDAHAVDTLFHNRRISDFPTLGFVIKPINKGAE